MSEDARATQPAAFGPVDAVYTWVDGGEQKFQEQFRQYVGKQASDTHASEATRFHDNQELRYSLRSLERYAPWVRRVYLVTNGQVPNWLNTTHPRLTLLHHEAVFPDRRLLPTFNSKAIEWQLFRIPNLSRLFLYFNDDVFLGRAIFPEDFVTPAGGQLIYVEHFDIPSTADALHATDRALTFTVDMLNGRYGARSARKKIAHVPHLFDRTILREVVHIWERQIACTATHRFRGPDDVSLQTLYDYYLLESPEQRNLHDQTCASAMSGTYIFVGLFSPVRRVWRRLLGVARWRPKFFCLNDELNSDSTVSNWLIRKSVRVFLRCYFWRVSSFEKGLRQRRRTHD
jgi:hypothetical protein